MLPYKLCLETISQTKCQAGEWVNKHKSHKVKRSDMQAAKGLPASRYHAVSPAQTPQQIPRSWELLPLRRQRWDCTETVLPVVFAARTDRCGGFRKRGCTKNEKPTDWRQKATMNETKWWGSSSPVHFRCCTNMNLVLLRKCQSSKELNLLQDSDSTYHLNGFFYWQLWKLVLEQCQGQNLTLDREKSGAWMGSLHSMSALWSWKLERLTGSTWYELLRTRVGLPGGGGTPPLIAVTSIERSVAVCMKSASNDDPLLGVGPTVSASQRLTWTCQISSLTPRGSGGIAFSSEQSNWNRLLALTWFGSTNKKTISIKSIYSAGRCISNKAWQTLGDWLLNLFSAHNLEVLEQVF